MSTEQTEYQIELFLSRVRRIQTEIINLEPMGFSLNNLQTESTTDILQTFPDYLLRESTDMSDCYQILYCFENDVRTIISDVMNEKYGPNWWEDTVSGGIKEEVKKRQKDEKESVYYGRIDDPLYFTTLGELKIILENNYEHFANHFRSQKFVAELLFQINRLRVVVGHNCMLEPMDIVTLKQNIERWYTIK